MKATTKLNVLAGAMMLALGSGVQAVEIDLFDTDQVLGTLTTPGTSSHSSVASATGILGGERDMYAELITGDGVDEMSVRILGGLLRIANDPGVAGRVQIQWDGVDNDSNFESPGVNLPPADWPNLGDATGLNFGLNGGAGVDWTGQDFIEIAADFSDFGYDFQFTLFTDEDEWTTVNLLANEVTGPGQHIGQIDLNAFINPGFCGQTVFPPSSAGQVNFISCGTGGTVDISKITAIVLDIDTDFNTGINNDGNGYQLSLDLRVDQIETTIPVPAPIALMGAGLLAVGFAGRRRRSRV
jgi:hypothetical protein